MPAEIGPPPRDSHPRHKYRRFFDLLTANPDKWVSLALDEVGGSTNQKKQSNITGSAKQFGFRVQTTIQDARLYVRIIEGVTVQVAPSAASEDDRE
jgi:hypothetical protein